MQTEAVKFKSARKSKNAVQTLLFIILALGAAIVVIPFVWMVITSFDRDAVVSTPFPPRFYAKVPTVDTYRIAFINIPMARYILNSFTIAGGTILFAICSAMLAGYALSKIKFRGSKLVLVFALSIMMIPFEASMVSQYLLFYRMNLLNSYWAFFLPAMAYPFGTFLVKQYMDTLPMSLREAAKIDGAGELSIFARIYLPLCGAITATMVILLFLDSWNSLIWPLLVLSNPAKYNIQIGMAMFTQQRARRQCPRSSSRSPP